MGGVPLRQGVVFSAVWFALGALVCYIAQQTGGGGGGTLAPAVLGALGPDRHHAVPCTLPAHTSGNRKNLVFAAAGDGWTPDMWGFGKNANWDLVAVYYGQDKDWDCPQCTLAMRMPDSMKWQMVWKLMTAKYKDKWGGLWGEWREQYEYVMVADDDLIMDACVINTVFETMKRRDLLVAQPSNCRGDDSDNPYWVHWQIPGMELHTVNVVEVTAPVIQMAFLDTDVRPLLKNTYSGWGLPFCFTAVAGFPHGRLAAIDSVCMIHPARDPPGNRTEKINVSTRIRLGLIKPGSIYARFGELTPFKAPRDEQQALWKQCGFNEENARKARMLFPPVQTMHGMVPLEPAVGQQLAAVGGQPGVQLMQLGLAAVAGAGVALAYLRRTRAGSGPRPVLQLHAIGGQHR